MKKASTKSKIKKNRFFTIIKNHKFIVIVVVIALSAGTYFTIASFASHQQRVSNTYSEFRFPDQPLGNEALEWSFKPLSNPAPQGFYWATQFWIKNSPDGKNPGNATGYIGLQNSANQLGKKAVLFSIWRANGGVTWINGSVSRHFDHEGSGYQIIAPYDWNVGTEYRFRLQYSGLNGRGEKLWTATIRNTSNNSTTTIGTIQVSGNWWGLDTVVSSWTEYYGGSLTNCASIPYVGAEYTKYFMQTGSNSYFATSQTNKYEAGQNCLGNSRITPITYGARQEISGSIYNWLPTTTTGRVIK